MTDEPGWFERTVLRAFPSGVLNLITTLAAPAVCEGKLVQTMRPRDRANALVLSHDGESVYVVACPDGSSWQPTHRVVLTVRADLGSVESGWRPKPPEADAGAANDFSIAAMALCHDGTVWLRWDRPLNKRVSLLVAYSRVGGSTLGGSTLGEVPVEFDSPIAADPRRGSAPPRVCVAEDRTGLAMDAQGRLFAAQKSSHAVAWLSPSAGAESDSGLDTSIGSDSSSNSRGAPAVKRKVELSVRVPQPARFVEKEVKTSASAAGGGAMGAELLVEPIALCRLGADLLLVAGNASRAFFGCVSVVSLGLGASDASSGGGSGSVRVLSQFGQLRGPDSSYEEELLRPCCVAGDAFGRVWVADSLGARLQLFH